MIKKNILTNLKKHILTGTSYMIPFIVAGGILYSVAIMLNSAPVEPTEGILGTLAMIGNAGLSLFIPALGGYIAFSIADRPGLAPGMIGGYLAMKVNAGFLGGILAGYIAGYTVKILKKIKLPLELKSVGTIFLYPIGGTLITGLIVVLIIGYPLSLLSNFLIHWIGSLENLSKIPLGIILGSMTAFDMGGPINKVATLFAQTQVDTLPYLMGGVGVAICTPSLGMGLATCLAPKKYSQEECQAGKGALIMGCVGITEGAIPFAINDPFCVIPSIIVGSSIGNIMAFMFNVLNHAPWGGLIVLPVIEGKIWYILSVVVGSLVTAVMVNFLKGKKIHQKVDSSDEQEFTFEEL